MQFLSSPAGSSHHLFVDLLEHASSVHLVDNHAHPILEPTEHANPGQWAIPRLEQLLSEATPVHPTAPTMTARTCLAHFRSVRDMGQMLAQEGHLLPPSPCEDNAQAEDGEKNHLHSATDDEALVEDARARLGVWPLAKLCVDAAKLSAILIDDGLNNPSEKERFVPYSAFEQRLGVGTARRVLRLETEAELCLSALIRENRDGKWSQSPHATDDRSPFRSPSHADQKQHGEFYYAETFLAEFRKRIDPLPPGVVSFKVAAAYRCGLQFDLSGDQSTYALLNKDLQKMLGLPPATEPDGTDANGTNDGVVPSSPEAGVNGKIRLERRGIVQWVVRTGCLVAQRHGIPIQFHCGFGDTDLDILQANPALLRNLFFTFPDVPIVLLHAAWPYSREAAFLASTYPSVFVDFGLAIPLLSVSGMVKAVQALLEIAPHNKVLYSSDSHSAADVIFLASVWGRKVLAAVLTEAVLCGDLTKYEAISAISNILADNATKLYKL